MIIKGLVDKKDFAIIDSPDRNNPFARAKKLITYKNIPLWTTISDSLDGYDFYVIDETKEYEIGFCYLACKDELNDIFSAAHFCSLDEMKQWLNNPINIK